MLKNVITVASEDLEEFEQYLYERENAGKGERGR